MTDSVYTTRLNARYISLRLSYLCSRSADFWQSYRHSVQYRGASKGSSHLRELDREVIRSLKFPCFHAGMSVGTPHTHTRQTTDDPLPQLPINRQAQEQDGVWRLNGHV